VGTVDGCSPPLVGSDGADCESEVVEPSDGGTPPGLPGIDGAVVTSGVGDDDDDGGAPPGLPGTDGVVVTSGVGDDDNDDDSVELPGTDGAVVTPGVGDDVNDDDSVGLPGTGVEVVTTGVDGVIIGSGVVDGWLVDSPGGTSPLLVCELEVDGNVDVPSVVLPVIEIVDVVVVVDGTFGMEDVVIESVGVSEGVDDGIAELVVSPVEELGSSVVLKHDCGIVSTTIKVALTYIPCAFLVPIYEV
jgi:hypothetical protein